MYVPGTVSDTSAVVTFILAVLHLCFQLQKVHLGVQCCKCAAKWVIWDERTLKHCLKGLENVESSKQRVELALGFYFIKSNGLYMHIDALTC